MEVCNEVLVQRRVAPDEAPLPAAGDWGALHRSEGSLCDTCQCGMFILLAVSPLGDEDWLFSSWNCSSQPHSSRDGWVPWVCYQVTATPGNGSAVFHSQGFADNGFDQGNSRKNPSALFAFLFLRVPWDPTKSILVSYSGLVWKGP